MDKVREDALKDVSQMEKESKYRIITIADDEEKQDTILKESYQKMQQLYQDFYVWLKDEHTQEQIQEKKAWLKQESERIYQQAKKQVLQIYEDERTQAIIEKGTEMVDDTKKWINKNVEVAYEQYKNSEFGKNVQEKIQDIKENEQVKKSIKGLKKNILKITEQTYTGIKKALEEKEEV